METVIDDEQKIKALVDYYKNNGLTIIGLNDSQGVNVTSTFLKKGLLEYLAYALTTDELNPTVINAFSLLMNKTEHIDYLLESNLSLEEIKLSQTYSAVSAFEKVMQDIHLPKFLGRLGYLYKFVYTPKEGDSDIHISTVLKESVEPTLIYSSGVNNLMREAGNNPFSIKGDYRKRFRKPNYNYTLRKANDPATLNTVIDGIEGNFEKILSINSKTDIYALGAYVPKSLESKGMNLFRDLVLAYNERLQDLCSSYHITYINTELIGKEFSNSEANFHISNKGHNRLANHILGYMYENKIANPANKEYVDNNWSPSLDEGCTGMILSLLQDYKRDYNKAMFLKDYGRERKIAVVNEHDREVKVFKKVMSQLNNK